MVWIPCLKHGMTNRNSVVWQSVVISLPNIQGVITANVQFRRVHTVHHSGSIKELLVRSAHPTLFIFLPAWERGHRPENQGHPYFFTTI